MNKKGYQGPRNPYTGQFMKMYGEIPNVMFTKDDMFERIDINPIIDEELALILRTFNKTLTALETKVEAIEKMNRHPNCCNCHCTKCGKKMF